MTMPLALTREKLLADLGIAGAPLEQQDEIVAMVGENVLKAVTLALFEKLPAEAHEEFKRLTDAGDAAATAALLRKYLPDPDAFVASEVQKEIDSYKEMIAR